MINSKALQNGWELARPEAAPLPHWLLWLYSLLCPHIWGMRIAAERALGKGLSAHSRPTRTTHLLQGLGFLSCCDYSFWVCVLVKDLKLGLKILKSLEKLRWKPAYAFCASLPRLVSAVPPDVLALAIKMYRTLCCSWLGFSLHFC